MTNTSRPTKAELHAMLAEAVRNTQPQLQQVDTPRAPVRKAEADPKPKKPARGVQPAPKRAAPKRAAKSKSARASGSRKRQR